MIVMPGHNCGTWWGYLAGKYYGRIAALMTPRLRCKPVPFAPYAIDNGAFAGFDEISFLKMIEQLKGSKPPLWIVVPDVVGDKEATLRLWNEWEPRLRPLRWPLAMAMQDGMTPDDFKGDIAFIGGSTRWKWRNLSMWKDVPRFHVGRVNTERHLWQAHEMGAESCDGTGWFRDATEEVPKLIRYLENSTNGKRHDTPPFPIMPDL